MAFSLDDRAVVVIHGEGDQPRDETALANAQDPIQWRKTPITARSSGTWAKNAVRRMEAPSIVGGNPSNNRQAVDQRAKRTWTGTGEATEPASRSLMPLGALPDLRRSALSV